MRPAPKPFNLHLFTTACMLSAAAMPMAADPAKREDVLRLVSDMTGQMMRGLDAYRASPQKAERNVHTTMWEQGSTKLLRLYKAAAKSLGDVLLVPSLINRFEVLDLDAQHSFAKYLSEQDFDVYCIDWGAPGKTEKTFRVDDYITSRLMPCLAQLNSPHVIGYCMGGTMAAAAAATMETQKKMRSLTLLAAPWDFHAGDKTVPLRMQAFNTSAQGVMGATQTLPVDWIQALFASIDPLFAFNKFRHFAGLDPLSPEARRFVIVEDWLNDGVDLSAPAATQALEEWYIANQPVNGVWTIGAKLVDAANIKIPTLVVAAGNDRLVPAPSALALAGQIAACDVMTPEIGHIGMMASDRAKQLVWAPVATWLQKN